METKQLLQETVNLCGELAVDGPSEIWRVRKRIMRTILKINQGWIKHEKWKVEAKLRQSPKAKVRTPVTEEDRANVKETAALYGQMNQHLRDLKVWTMD